MFKKKRYDALDFYLPTAVQANTETLRHIINVNKELKVIADSIQRWVEDGRYYGIIVDINFQKATINKLEDLGYKVDILNPDRPSYRISWE